MFEQTQDYYGHVLNVSPLHAGYYSVLDPLPESKHHMVCVYTCGR